MNFLKNPCNIYLTLWGLYSLKGIIYPDGSIINQALMLLIILMSLNETYKVVSTKQTPPGSIFFRGLNILLFMYTVYGAFLFVTDGFTVYGRGNQVPSMYFLEGAWVILMPIYVCYSYTKRGYLNAGILRNWMIVFLAIAIAQYYHTQSVVLQMMIDKGRSNVDEITNNAGYILLSLIPGMLLFRKKAISYLGIAICVMFIIMSMKRGAMLIGAISLALIILHDLRESKGAYKIGVVILVLAGLAILVNYVGSMLENSEYFNLRLQTTLEGDTSERDEIYSNYWNIFLNESNLFQMILGRGGLATIKLSGVYAHNDWLEILIGQGILGIIIFINYWWRFYKSTRTPVLSDQSRFILLLLLCIFGIKSFFSMSITGMPIYATSVLGLALANGCKQNNSKNR